ncbi:MAG: DUF1402 family protein [Candidatus Shapirobacteria bacterium]|nr:DUF1402 family protein [Candidatus Shapirobacteria bacterium]
MMVLSVKKIARIAYFLMLYTFAIVGFVFVGMFFAIRLKITDVKGSVDNLSQNFQNQAEENQIIIGSFSNKIATSSGELDNIKTEIDKLTIEKDLKIKNLCSLEELSYIAPKNVDKILTVKKQIKSDLTVAQMIFAIKTYLTDKDSFDKNVSDCMSNFESRKVNEDEIITRVKNSNSQNIFVWPDEDQWKTVSQSITKDKDIINRAALMADIDPRLIVSDLVVEQLRVYYSARELYKQYFEPLKILSNMNKISLGVMAIKEDTAAQIESHLKDRSSPYYLGEKYENILNYNQGQNLATERYNRLMDNNHYYSYLYAGLYLKQMMTQWKNAGFDISSRPEIVGTLFNVGFPQSKPNANPKIGGSTVQIGQNKYSFGRLSYEFFYSGELTEIFPCF